MAINPDWLLLLICGAAGAFIKDTLTDNKIQLPKFDGGYLHLGSLGGIIIGSLAGYIVDNDPITAFLGGYAGTQIIQNLVTPKKTNTETDSIK